ncbi:hypothetical protein PRNP1_004664 [Phytophthora ramorum]
MCKADISFLLNPPSTVDHADYGVEVVVPPSPPSMSLFRSLSPAMRAQSPEPTSPSTSYQRRLIASCIAPREKKFNSMRSYGDDKAKLNLPMLSLAALCVSSEAFHPITEPSSATERLLGGKLVLAIAFLRATAEVVLLA